MSTTIKICAVHEDIQEKLISWVANWRRLITSVNRMYDDTFTTKSDLAAHQRERETKMRTMGYQRNQMRKGRIGNIEHNGTVKVEVLS